MKFLFRSVEEFKKIVYSAILASVLIFLFNVTSSVGTLVVPAEGFYVAMFWNSLTFLVLMMFSGAMVILFFMGGSERYIARMDVYSALRSAMLKCNTGSESERIVSELCSELEIEVEE